MCCPQSSENHSGAPITKTTNKTVRNLLAPSNKALDVAELSSVSVFLFVHSEEGEGGLPAGADERAAERGPKSPVLK